MLSQRTTGTPKRCPDQTSHIPSWHLLQGTKDRCPNFKQEVQKDASETPAELQVPYRTEESVPPKGRARAPDTSASPLSPGAQGRRDP